MISTYERNILTKKRNKDKKEKSYVLPVDTYQKKKKIPADSTGLMPVSSCTRVDLPLPLLLGIGSSSNISLCYIKLSFKYHFKVVYLFY